MVDDTTQNQVQTAASVAVPAQALAVQSEKLKLLQDAVVSANIPQLVLNTISYALDLGSSDIHIEPSETRVRIRYRVDGVLRLIVEYPQNIHPAVVSRVKIMSDLKIDESRVPQDGRSQVTTKDGRKMDLRISTLPTVNGEKIVMRIQDKSRKIPDLPELGVAGKALAAFEDALKIPNGIILTTGPTGSGKTTTLYSALNRLNQMDVNILTIEDPVEIVVDGLNQSQTHHEIEYTFASGMRAALRQDPDIIMVGEIRDKETGDTAIEASLTGHLVLSTLHTNSAVETLVRLLNMGIPGYLLNGTIELIIAQRLVRKLCDCKVPAQAPENLKDQIEKVYAATKPDGEMDPAQFQAKKLYGPGGCEKCEKSGYKGRLGLYEVLKMTDELRELIFKESSMMEIEKVAVHSGMLTLEQAGLIKALEGKTSIDEVYKVARKVENY